MADYGLPRPRHSYTYVPRPMPGQRGALVYNGPLNQTGAMQPRPMNMNMGMGVGMGVGMGMPMGVGMGGMGMMGAGYGVRHANQPYYPHQHHHSQSYCPYRHHSQHDMRGRMTNPYYGREHGGLGHHSHINNHNYNYGWYANPSLLHQSPYMYPPGGMANPYYGPGTSAVYPMPAAPVQYTYVRAAATPRELPREYRSADYTSRFTRAHAEADNRRVATERGAYRPRRIKPADARPHDLFWCRERDGQWTLRKYYQIEDNCHPGVWKMDAEFGFLVFVRS